MLNPAPEQRATKWQGIPFILECFSWNCWHSMMFHEFHGISRISLFYENVKFLGNLRFRADLAPRMPVFYLQNKAILRAGRCRWRFRAILWKLMKFYKIKENVKMLILQNFHKIHKNAPGPQNHYYVQWFFSGFATKKCKMWPHAPKC